MKKIIIISGSPNERSTTQELAEEIVNKVTSEKKFYTWTTLKLSEKNILRCKGCKQCFRTGTCYRNNEDDMEAIVEAIRESDVAIWATPSYINHIPGSMKNFIDRLASSTHKMDFAGISAFTFVTSSNSGRLKIEEYLNDTLAWLGFKVMGNFGFAYSENIGREQFIEETCFNIMETMKYAYGHSSLQLEKNFRKLYSIPIFTSSQEVGSRFEWHYWNRVREAQIKSFQCYSKKMKEGQTNG